MCRSRDPGRACDWGDKRVYEVGERTFARAGRGGDAAPPDAFKASELGLTILVESGLARPAPYAARANRVELVAARLTRQVRARLGLVPCGPALDPRGVERLSVED